MPDKVCYQGVDIGPNLLNLQAPVIDLNTTISDQSVITGAYGGGAPVDPPATSDGGDLHIEYYTDAIVYWVSDGALFNPLPVAEIPLTAGTIITGGAPVDPPSAGDNIYIDSSTGAVYYNNGGVWTPASTSNIYSADGSITGVRTVTLDPGASLTVEGAVAGGTVMTLDGDTGKVTIPGIIDPLLYVGSPTNCGAHALDVNAGQAGLFVSDGSGDFLDESWVHIDSAGNCNLVSLPGTDGGSPSVTITAGPPPGLPDNPGPGEDIYIDTVANQWYYSDGNTWIAQATAPVVLDEVDTSVTAASVDVGAVPGAKVGVDPATGDLLYVDGAGEWQLVPYPATSFQTLTTAPAAPVEGDVYYDTGDDVTYVYDGTTWVAISEGAATSFQVLPAAPTVPAPAAGDTYYDSTDNSAYVYNGSGWVSLDTIPNEVVYGAAALSGAAPADGELGVNNTDGSLYYKDGAGDWAIVPGTGIDLNTTVSDQTGANYVPGSAPADTSDNPTPDPGDLHIEQYDDVVVYWVANAGSWPAASVISTPLTPTVDATLTTGTLLTATTARSANFGGQTLTLSNAATIAVSTTANQKLSLTATDAVLESVVAAGAVRLDQVGGNYYLGNGAGANLPDANTTDSTVLVLTAAGKVERRDINDAGLITLPTIPNEVVYGGAALAGAAPADAELGVNNTDGALYYKDGAGDWQTVPVGGGLVETTTGGVIILHDGTGGSAPTFVDSGAGTGTLTSNGNKIISVTGSLQSSGTGSYELTHDVGRYPDSRVYRDSDGVGLLTNGTLTSPTLYTITGSQSSQANNFKWLF